MGMAKYLKRFLFILVILTGSFRIEAQDPEYFIYLQSERSQPFYVRYDGKLLSSSDKGYLIISRMHAGTASLRIGFANSNSPEQQFLVKLTGSNDQGYLIKKDGDNGYALYNLQTFAAIRPNTNKDVHKEPVAAAVVKDTVVEVAAAPAPAPAPADTDVQMASLRKDLDSTFANKSDVTVGPGSRLAGPITPAPAKQSNKFSQALDKVVGDDRVEEVVPVEDTPVVDSAVVTTDAPAVEAAPVKKGRKKRRDREALTPEEQQLAAAVLAEEHLTAATVTDTTVAVAVATEEVPAPVPVTEKKSKKHKKSAEDPAFINFVEDSTKQAAVPAATEPEFVAPADPAVVPVTGGEETPASGKKKKRRIETVENPVDNIVTDSSNGYAVTDLSIDHPKESKRDRKKKQEKQEKEAAAAAAAAMPVTAPPVLTTEVSVENKPAAVQMINSDCGKVLDETNFRKVLRKFVAGKDDEGMIDAFRRQTKGYCLETSQIKTLVQLLGTNESRYRLLDLAYPKVSDSGKYDSLESVLTDDYYKGRFKAMLHK